MNKRIKRTRIREELLVGSLFLCVLLILSQTY
jgi:hypothetical protein